MKKYLLCLLVVSFFSFAMQNKFDLVVANAVNEHVKNRLIQFHSGGIEKAQYEYDVEEAIADAEALLGTIHRMGGTSKQGIDCSGLVFAIHAKQGVKLPHSSHEQARYGEVIPFIDELERGDLVFYYNSYESKNFITHVGIYLGERKMIHVSTKNGVVVTDVADKYYWGERFLFGTRLKK